MVAQQSVEGPTADLRPQGETARLTFELAERVVWQRQQGRDVHFLRLMQPGLIQLEVDQAAGQLDGDARHAGTDRIPQELAILISPRRQQLALEPAVACDGSPD